MLVIGIFPSLILIPIERIVSVFDPSVSVKNTFIPISSIVSTVGTASLLMILLIGSVFLVRSKIARNKVTSFSSTWACGYTAPTMRMQYTGKSFSKTLAKLFAFITGEEKKYSEIEHNAVFPTSRSYQSNYAEFFEKNIFNKASNQLLHFMNYFSFIHNGRVQMYVLYGFIFMMILIMATFFNIL